MRGWRWVGSLDPECGLEEKFSLLDCRFLYLIFLEESNDRYFGIMVSMCLCVSW